MSRQLRLNCCFQIFTVPFEPIFTVYWYLPFTWLNAHYSLYRLFENYYSTIDKASYRDSMAPFDPEPNGGCQWKLFDPLLPENYFGDLFYCYWLIVSDSWATPLYALHQKLPTEKINWSYVFMIRFLSWTLLSTDPEVCRLFWKICLIR